MKRISTLPVFLFLSFLSYSQGWKKLDDRVMKYYSRGEYALALPLAEREVTVARKEFGEAHPNYALSLNHLAFMYRSTGEYKKAESAYIKSGEVYKKAFGAKDPEYGGNLNTLAILYYTTGEYKKAEPLYLQAREIFNNALGKTNSRYGDVVNNLALLYKSMGQYEKAEPLYIESTAIRKKNLGVAHPDYATSLNNLAGLYKTLGNFEKAKELFIESNRILKKSAGEKHPDYANSLNNLADLYSQMGQYEKAEPLFLQAMEIRKKALGQASQEFGASLYNLAFLYRALGQYEKSETLFLKALAVFEKSVGETSPDFAKCVHSLAELYYEQGYYEEAGEIYLVSEKLMRKTLGEDHIEYAVCLNDLGKCYHQTGNNEKAKQILTASLEKFKNIVGEDHPFYAANLNSLGATLEALGQYGAAEQLYIKCTDIYKRNFGENNIDYADFLANLTLLYFSTGHYEKAERFMFQNNNTLFQNLVNIFAVLSENEKNNYLIKESYLLECNNSFLYNYKNALPSSTRAAFNQQIFFTSLSLSNTKDVMEAVENSTDTAILGLLNRWKDKKVLLSRQYSLPADEKRKDISELELQTEALEKELNRRSVAFYDQQRALQVSMEDVQKNLQQDEVAIEFVQFQLYNKSWSDSILYAAFILNKTDSVPRFVPICGEKQLAGFFTHSGTSEASIKAVYRSEIMDDTDSTVVLGDSLYSVIWKPLLPYLEGVKKINYSAAGLLNRVAFHALPAGDSQLLIDKYQLNRYISTRQIALANGVAVSKERSIALFGDPSFTMDSISMVRNIVANESAANTYSAEVSRSGNREAWISLSGTAKEISDISSLFEKNKIVNYNFTRQKATEEQFKSLSGRSPAILHLATHGFFLPDPGKKRNDVSANVFSIADDPMLRSGIVLAGANRAWQGKSPLKGREDGIVTAYEISQMDLRNTDLVVLSACETALGDIKGTEGVFGLQRAFKLAGVKNMLLSLWKVPDAETAELMTTFYTYYLEGETAREALNNAQKVMRKKYTPYYWAAFVLIE